MTRQCLWLQLAELTAGAAEEHRFSGRRHPVLRLGLGREVEAREAYTRARNLATAESTQPNLAMLEQKLQSLNPVPERVLETPASAAPVATESGTTEAPVTPAQEG